MFNYKFKLISFAILLVLLIIVSGIPSSANAQAESPMAVLNNNIANGTNGSTGTGAPTNSTQPTTQAPKLVSTLPVVQQGNSVVFTIGSDIVTDDGTQYQIDVAPFIDSNGCTQVPVRYLADGLGATNIAYSPSTQLVSMLFGDNQINIALTIGSFKMYVGNSTVTMDTVPVIVPPGRTMLPARFIAEALGDTVNWDPTAKQVTITVPAPSSANLTPIPGTEKPDGSYEIMSPDGPIDVINGWGSGGTQDPNTMKGFVDYGM